MITLLHVLYLVATRRFMKVKMTSDWEMMKEVGQLATLDLAMAAALLRRQPVIL